MVTSNTPLHSLTVLAARSALHVDVSYARHVEPLAVVRSTPRRLRSQLRATPPSESAARAAALAQRTSLVLGKIAEAELLFAFRLRQAASGQHRSADALHDDGWRVTPMFAHADEAVALFTRLRRWNLRFIRATTPLTGERLTSAHPEAVRAIVEAMAHHDITRLDDLASLR